MTAAIFLGVMMLLASDTALGRSLRYWLVARPAARLTEVTAGRMIVVAACATIGGLVLWFGGQDGARMLGLGLPDFATAISALEVSAYLDVLVAVVATASLVRLRGGGAIVISLIRRLTGRENRTRSSRRRPVDRDAANDDERRADVLIAA